MNRWRRRGVRAAAGLVLLGLTSVPATATGQDAHPAVNLTHDPSEDRYPAWSPAGGALAFESNRDGNWNLFLMDPRSGNVTRLTDDPANDRYPGWAPDGLSLVFFSDRGGRPALYTLEILSGDVNFLVEVDGAEPSPSWSPDGTTIAYASRAGDALQVFLTSSDGREIQRVTEGPYRSLWPRWSPDGGLLAFFSRRDTSGQDDEVYLWDPVVGATQRVTNRPAQDFCPAWSPDGSLLVMASSGPGDNRSLRITDLEGDEIAVLATGFARVTQPSWSPDGRGIAFAARTADGDWEIYRVTVPEAAIEAGEMASTESHFQ